MTEEAVRNALSQIIDPDLHRDIVSLGFVKKVEINGGDVSVNIELTTPACPVKDKFKEQATTLISEIEGVENVTVNMSAKVNTALDMSKNLMVPGVKNIIPVASGKGGVGKSTVSANLALALASTGATVGLLDADIYGPSIPIIMGIKEPPRQKGNVIMPVTEKGIKVISMGMFMKDDQAVMWRGPMLAKMVEQFLSNVDWGHLDYLIVDLPPGTGDVQLTLCQSVPITGSVIVSTPQDLAFNVARKAILMFNKLKSPVLGIIENMSYYTCSSCGHQERIFGKGGCEKAVKEFNIPMLGNIPLATNVRKTADEGRPVVFSNPDSQEASAFLRAAEKMAAQISVQNLKNIEDEIKVSF